jgi:ABC-2 type transport system permease protein
VAESAIAQLGVWRRLVGARIRSGWQYRTSFFLFLLSQTLVMCLDFAVILSIFTKVDALAGWSAVEVALLYGLSGVAFGMADTFISAVENATTHIKAGTFDLFLLRPVSPLLHLTASEFELRRIGRVLQPLAVLVGAVVLLEVDWTAGRVALVPLTLVAGTVIFGAVWIATSAMAFWTVESQEMGNAFTYGGNLAAQYPLDVLGDWLRHLFTFVFPLAFVAYLPASEIVGKDTPLGLPDWTVWSSPLVALLAALVALAVWRAAIRHHQSTGS